MTGRPSCGTSSRPRRVRSSAATRGPSWRRRSTAGRARSTPPASTAASSPGTSSATGASDARSTRASARATSVQRRRSVQTVARSQPLRTTAPTASSTSGPLPATTSTSAAARAPARPLPRHDLHISGGPRLGYVQYDPAFGPRGTLIVTSYKGFIGLADARTGRIRATLHGHHDLVFAPTTSAGGRMLATTGFDQTLRLWDAVAARPLGPPIHLPSPPASLASHATVAS